MAEFDFYIRHLSPHAEYKVFYPRLLYRIQHRLIVVGLCVPYWGYEACPPIVERIKIWESANVHDCPIDVTLLVHLKLIKLPEYCRQFHCILLTLKEKGQTALNLQISAYPV